MTIRRQHGRRLRAFTLIEALTTIVVLTVLGSVSSTIIFTAADSYLEAATRSEIHGDLSVTMDRLVREIRAIPLDTAATGIAPDINYFSATDLRWSTPQSRIWAPSTYAYLSIDGSPLYLTLSDVSSFTIRAFDEDNVELVPPLSAAACDPICRIEIDMAVTRAGVTDALRTKVFIRSTMSGAGS